MMTCILPCRKPQLLRSTAASFYCFVVGYLLLVFAADIKLLLVSTVVRSAGSAVLWIYSTLMLQYIVPNQLLGRVMALEMALFTVCLAPCMLLQKAFCTCACIFVASPGGGNMTLTACTPACAIRRGWLMVFSKTQWLLPDP